MKKRIMSLLAIVALLSSLMAMPVNADMVHKENYDNFTADDNPTSVTSWVAYGGATGASFEDGDLKIEKTESTTPIYDLRITTNGDNMTLLFDMKQAKAQGVGGYLHTGGGSRLSSSVSNPEAYKWYTHMFRVRDNAETGKKEADWFIKGPFETPEEKEAATWTKRGTLTGISDSGDSAGIRLNFGATNDTNLGQILWIDNIELHQGLYMSERKFQTSYIDGGAPVETEVTTVDEIVAAATAPAVALETKLDFYDCNFAVGDTAFGPTLDVHPVLLALDENGMLLDCAIASKSINPLGMDNKVTVGLPDITSYVNQIDKVQLLIWDSIEGMQPIFDAVELN